MIVPDTMQGATLLSIIDFLLSIVMITAIGFVLSLFPLLNRLKRHPGAKADAKPPHHD
ncbi:hypothetical protein GALL_196400 [mine drainage metagenome]|uniref:Uncharacterized protein n=1 Tax=mine drainage metagenome TaxID=410659 RepID=A0A1J5RRT9_9ZZZZ